MSRRKLVQFLQIKLKKSVALSLLVRFPREKWITMRVRRRENLESVIRRCSKPAHSFAGTDHQHVFRLSGLTSSPIYFAAEG